MSPTYFCLIASWSILEVTWSIAPESIYQLTSLTTLGVGFFIGWTLLKLVRVELGIMLCIWLTSAVFFPIEHWWKSVIDSIRIGKWLSYCIKLRWHRGCIVCRIWWLVLSWICVGSLLWWWGLLCLSLLCISEGLYLRLLDIMTWFWCYECWWWLCIGLWRVHISGGIEILSRRAYVMYVKSVVALHHHMARFSI